LIAANSLGNNAIDAQNSYLRGSLNNKNGSFNKLATFDKEAVVKMKDFKDLIFNLGPGGSWRDLMKAVRGKRYHVDVQEIINKARKNGKSIDDIREQLGMSLPKHRSSASSVKIPKSTTPSSPGTPSTPKSSWWDDFKAMFSGADARRSAYGPQPAGSTVLMGQKPFQGSGKVVNKVKQRVGDYLDTNWLTGNPLSQVGRAKRRYWKAMRKGNTQDQVEALDNLTALRKGDSFDILENSTQRRNSAEEAIRKLEEEEAMQAAVDASSKSRTNAMMIGGGALGGGAMLAGAGGSPSLSENAYLRGQLRGMNRYASVDESRNKLATLGQFIGGGILMSHNRKRTRRDNRREADRARKLDRQERDMARQKDDEMIRSRMLDMQANSPISEDRLLKLEEAIAKLIELNTLNASGSLEHDSNLEDLNKDASVGESRNKLATLNKKAFADPLTLGVGAAGLLVLNNLANYAMNKRIVRSGNEEAIRNIRAEDAKIKKEEEERKRQEKEDKKKQKEMNKLSTLSKKAGKSKLTPKANSELQQELARINAIPVGPTSVSGVLREEAGDAIDWASDRGVDLVNRIGQSDIAHDIGNAANSTWDWASDRGQDLYHRLSQTDLAGDLEGLYDSSSDRVGSTVSSAAQKLQALAPEQYNDIVAQLAQKFQRGA